MKTTFRSDSINILCPFAEKHVKAFRQGRSPDDIPTPGDRIVVLTTIGNVWRGTVKVHDEYAALYRNDMYVDVKRDEGDFHVVWRQVQRWAFDPFANYEDEDDASR